MIKSIFTGLLPEKKGERLMTEILERYVTQSEWHQSSRAKGVFEKVLLDILHRGDSALVGFSDDELNAHVFPQQHQHHQSLGKMASIPTMKLEFSDSGGTSGRPVFGSKNIDQHGNFEPRALLTGRQAIVEEFFIEACLDILDVLEDFSPPCLFELSRMINQDLDESAKPYASLIIVVKFFFYRFMNKCIAYPEVHHPSKLLGDFFVFAISSRSANHFLSSEIDLWDVPGYLHHGKTAAAHFIHHAPATVPLCDVDPEPCSRLVSYIFLLRHDILGSYH